MPSKQPIEDMLLYRCFNAQCQRQFFSTEKDAVCICGTRATLSECQDLGRTEHTIRDELLSLRRSIYLIVKAAGGRVEINMRDLETLFTDGHRISVFYDHTRNRQVWETQDRPSTCGTGVPKQLGHG